MLRFSGMPAGAPEGTEPSPIGYRLEPGHNGGSDPMAPHCGSPSFGDRVYTADCVGFVLWCLGSDRLQPGFKGFNGEWLNCASILRDSQREQLYFEPVPDPTHVLPADALITATHIGLIVRVGAGDFDCLVADCSPRHGRKTAVGLGNPWDDACRVVRYRHFAA